MSEATLRPWAVVGGDIRADGSYEWIAIEDANGEQLVCIHGEDVDFPVVSDEQWCLAELIVKAVNLFPELLEALERLRELYPIDDDVRANPHCACYVEADEAARDVLKKVREE